MQNTRKIRHILGELREYTTGTRNKRVYFLKIGINKEKEKLKFLLPKDSVIPKPFISV
jgi:hypothetical protein